MTQRSFAWEGQVLGDCGPYTQLHLQDQFFRSLLNGTGNRGVLPYWGSVLAVTGTSSPITVAPGGAVVYGMFYQNGEAVSVSIPTPSAGLSRYDLIVVRRVWGTQTVRIARVAGVAAASPSVPTPTQTVNVIWEIPLASVHVTDGGVITITDAREYCTFTTAWPANSADTEAFGEGSVTDAAIPDRTRWDLVEAGQFEADTANPATWVAAPPYDHWQFANAATNIVWLYKTPEAPQVGLNLSLYLWSVPAVNGAGAGAENVRWVYNYSIVAPEAVAGFTTNPVLVDQQFRVNTTVYRDLLVALAAASTGSLLILSVSREGGHAADTYASNMRLLGVEFNWTAEA